MTIKFDKIKPGMKLYDGRKRKPNEYLWSKRKWVYWVVHIKEVDYVNRTVVASWNSNPYETMHERRVTKFRAKLPKDM